MIVLFGTQRESNHDSVEKCRVIELRPTAPKILADVEFEFVLAGQEQVAHKQRVFRAPVCIGDCRGFEITAPIQQVQANIHVRRGDATGRVQYVRCQSSHAHHYTILCYCLASDICCNNNNKAKVMTNRESTSRRQFLQSAGALSSASYLRMLAPAAAAIAQAACSARDEEAPFMVLEAAEAKDFAAIAARILPTTETPGANEAGVIYFIDRAFAEEMSGQLEFAREQLSELNIELGEGRFADLDAAAQDELLHGMQSSPLFNMLWAMTIFGFLAMPEHGGNKNKVGWDLIGFEGDHGPWTYPFGYYDAQVHGEANDGE